MLPYMRLNARGLLLRTNYYLGTKRWFTLTIDQVDELRLIQLKQELGKRGQRTSGTKGSLRERLKELMRTEGVIVPPDDETEERVSQEEEEEDSLSPEMVDGLRLIKLKQALTSRGESTSGTKGELRERLKSLLLSRKKKGKLALEEIKVLSLHEIKKELAKRGEATFGARSVLVTRLEKIVEKEQKRIPKVDLDIVDLSKPHPKMEEQVKYLEKEPRLAGNLNDVMGRPEAKELVDGMARVDWKLLQETGAIATAADKDPEMKYLLNVDRVKKFLEEGIPDTESLVNLLDDKENLRKVLRVISICEKL